MDLEFLPGSHLGAGVLTPAGAQAAVATTKLTSGKPVKATISTPGQQVSYTFAAKANANVALIPYEANVGSLTIKLTA